MKNLFLLLILCSCAVPDVLLAQDTIQGVVWSRPDSPAQSLRDLSEMRDAGITAVRTGPVTDQAILSMADSVGIRLYREIPLYEYSASRLVDSTAFAMVLLRDLVESGAGHVSAGPIGLAVRADVSDPRACTYFTDVTSGIETPSAQTYYYVGSFVDDDSCSGTVDFVLLDLLDEKRPYLVLARWGAVHETRAGIGAIGTWVEEGSDAGLGVPNSQEMQARFIEKSLAALRKRTASIQIFLHRWQDESEAAATSYPGSRDVFGRNYGLKDEKGTDRPAMQVVEGFFRNEQTVFAFQGGEVPVRTTSGITILGWILILIVALLYASSPRFRYMVPRYFLAHGFFRNSVREAREVLPIVSTALLTVVGLSIGVAGLLTLTLVSDTAPFLHIARILPDASHATLTSLLTQPMMPVVLLGSVSLLAMSAWMGLWVMVGSGRVPLLPSQALMLAVWPRWPMLVLLPVVMSLSTLDPGQSLGWLTLLVPVWIGGALWSTVRTSYDLFKVTHCRLEAAILIWLFNPIWLLLSGGVVLILVYSEEATYVWHLIMRT